MVQRLRPRKRKWALRLKRSKKKNETLNLRGSTNYPFCLLDLHQSNQTFFYNLRQALNMCKNYNTKCQNGS